MEYLCCFYLIVCYCAANQEKDKAEKAKNEAKNEGKSEEFINGLAASKDSKNDVRFQFFFVSFCKNGDSTTFEIDLSTILTGRQVR